MNDNTTCAYVVGSNAANGAGPTDWVVPDEEVIERHVRSRGGARRTRPRLRYWTA